MRCDDVMMRCDGNQFQFNAKKRQQKKGLKKSDPDSTKKKEVTLSLNWYCALLPWAAFLRPTAHIYCQALLVHNAGDRISF